MKLELGSSLWALVPAVVVALSFGCANPAANAPEAEVSEPTESEPAASEGGDVYVLTADSSVGFVGSKVTGSHEGGFETVEGTITLVGGDPAQSSVDVTIDTTSVWSDNDDLTGHLMNEDFFEVETYPTSTFTSTSIVASDATTADEAGDGEVASDDTSDEAATDDTYTITGNLTLRGVTKQIAFPATIAVSEGGVHAQAEFSIKRFDFNIVYKGRADDLIRDDVLIKLDLKAVPEGETAMDGGEDMAAMDGEAHEGDEGGDS